MLILKVCPLHVTGTSACRRIFGEGGCQDMIEDLRELGKMPFIEMYEGTVTTAKICALLIVHLGIFNF